MASSPSSVLSPPASDLLGCEEPRVFTPPLRPLTPQTTAGFALIEFATVILGMDLLPWQRWLAIHALELLPDGTFRFRTVLLLVARQNGKSTFLQVLALFFLYIRGVNLVIGTAQNLDIAEEVWQGAVDIAQGVPELADEIEDVVMKNGSKALKLRRGERYKVQAANRRGGRGLSGDLVLMDELREHHKWDAWGAVTKTTMARPLAQIWAASNAGDASSVVLAFLRKLAHLALGDPDKLREPGDGPKIDVQDDSLGIFEWSAAPGCSLDDPHGAAQANPSVGYTIPLRAITSARRTDPEWVYRTEVFCQWEGKSQDTAIPPDLWSLLADPKAARGQHPVFGLAVATDRSWSAIAVAWRRPDERVQVMLADYRPDVAWLPARLLELQEKWGGSVAVASQSARGLVVGAEQPSQELQAQAHVALFDAVIAGSVRHGNEPALNTAVRGAKWRSYGDSGRIFDRKGSLDIGPLDAAALAVHGVLSGVKAESIYETREPIQL